VSPVDAALVRRKLAHIAELGGPAPDDYFGGFIALGTLAALP
jgi:hypothetical protein